MLTKTGSVAAEIKKAMRPKGLERKNHVNPAEAKRIVAVADKAGEMHKVVALFERAQEPRLPPSNRPVTLTVPENPNQVTMDPEAKETFNAMFRGRNIPAGDNVEAMKARALKSIENVSMTAMDKAPRGVARMFQVDITPVGLFDIGMTAFIDVKKGLVYKRMLGFMGPGGPMRPMERWSGPAPLVSAPHGAIVPPPGTGWRPAVTVGGN